MLHLGGDEEPRQLGKALDIHSELRRRVAAPHDDDIVIDDQSSGCEAMAGASSVEITGSSSPRSRKFSTSSVPLGRQRQADARRVLETFAHDRCRERNRTEVVERDDEDALGGRRRKDIRLQRKLKFVQRAAHRSRQLLRARGRGHARWGADEQLVFQPVAQPAQRVARGRLAEMQEFGGAGDAPLVQNRKAYKAACRAAPRKRAMRVQPPSREALQPPVRVAFARRITMSIRRSITLFTLLLSLSAAPFVAANVPADSRPTRLSRRR
jgi:hypothetical protein